MPVVPRGAKCSGNRRGPYVFLSVAKEVSMDRVVIADRLRETIGELDQVRRGLMADEQRRENYRKTVGLLSLFEQAEQSFRSVAE